MSDCYGKREEGIIEAARHEFGAKGFTGARTKAIADAAGVNKAMVHYYFRSKEELYIKTIEHTASSVWGSIENRLRDIEESCDIKRFIHRFVREYIAVLTENPDLFRLFVKEVSEGGKHLPVVFGTAFPIIKRIMERYRELVGIGKESGNLRDRDPDDIISDIFGMCFGSVFFYTFFRGSDIERVFDFPEREEFLERRVESIVETLFHGIMKEERSIEGERSI